MAGDLPRVHAELVARGRECCENTVARVMREAGLAAKPKRTFRQTTDSHHPHPVVANVLDRAFDPAEPNASWSEAGATCSMSRRGNCWDNAPMKSFFASLKKELVHDKDYATRVLIFEYIEVFTNRVRRHSTLGYLTPAEYERVHNQTHR